jgi:hypothetical protein
VHAHVSEKSHNTQLAELVARLGRYCISLAYGMVESQILVQLLPLVLEKVPLDCEEVPFPSCADIHSPDALLCIILCTEPEVVLVLVWLIIEYSSLVPIFVTVFVTNLHLLETSSSSDSMDNLPCLRSSSISPRFLLRMLSAFALKEFSLEVVILGCSIRSSDLHELDVLASQLHL